MFELGWYLYIEDWAAEQLEDLVELELTFIYVSKRKMRRSDLLKDKGTKKVTCCCIIQKTKLDNEQAHERGTLFHVHGLFCVPDKGVPEFGIGFWGWLYCDDITGAFCSGPVWPL